jgi:hypothetical protein
VIDSQSDAMKHNSLTELKNPKSDSDSENRSQRNEHELFNYEVITQ